MRPGHEEQRMNRTPQIRLFRYEPGNYEALQGFCQNASPASRKACLWDCSNWTVQHLRKILDGSECACIAKKGSEFLALAWISPLSWNSSRAGTLHFMQTRASLHDIHEAGRLFLFSEHAPALHYQSLLCLVPRCYRPTHRLLARLGFDRLAELPGACFMANGQTLENGYIYLLKRQ